MFQASAFVDDLHDDGQPWGKRHVCGGCDLRHSKPPKLTQIDGSFDPAEIEQIINRVEAIAAEQQAGFAYQLHELTPLELECLCHWHAVVSNINRAQQSHLTQMLGALFR